MVRSVRQRYVRRGFSRQFLRDCMKTPDRRRSGTPPSAKSGLRGLYLGVWCYRRPTIGASPTTFHTVSPRTPVNRGHQGSATGFGEYLHDDEHLVAHAGLLPLLSAIPNDESAPVFASLRPSSRDHLHGCDALSFP